MATKDDPRDASLQTRMTLPASWSSKSKSPTEMFSTSTMMMSGLIMLSRNRFLAWPSLLFGINSIINAHPARMSDGGGHYSAFFLSLSALFASYLPLFMITKVAGPVPPQ
ncbi:hypothetical protein BDV98DRAFT_563238 [Pterulicium gracile]|uniref:Uncharacterized protein n=1 Tax=Pterulicium gracile TaxID=1884261 RepID=A0A5C3QU98_9AGAR|nr:hypothetical protein BDV98DRAFT_563238 [Pterula gracilis]